MDISWLRRQARFGTHTLQALYSGLLELVSQDLFAEQSGIVLHPIGMQHFHSQSHRNMPIPESRNLGMWRGLVGGTNET